MVNVFHTQRRRRESLIYYSKHIEKVDRHHFSLDAESIDNNIGMAIRSSNRDRTVKVAESHGFDTQQQRTLAAIAAQDDGAAGIAMHGDRE